MEASLRRLDTPYLDLLQIHRFDPHTPPEETMSTLHSLVCSGKVRYIGASSMWTYQFATLQNVAERNGWTKFVSMQNHYNLLYREEEREMNRYCDETGVGLIPWAPLCRGHLARKPEQFGGTVRSEGEKKNAAFAAGWGEADDEIVRRVVEVAEKRGWDMSHVCLVFLLPYRSFPMRGCRTDFSMYQVALAWINARVTSPIIGFSSVARMDEALAARGKELTPDEIKYLEEPYRPKQVQGHS